MSDQKTKRRNFLKTAGLTAAALGLTVCGGGTLAATLRPKVDLPASELGENGRARVLVAYGSKAGSTAEIALRMGEAFAAYNLAVDVRPVKEVSSLAGYTGVVLGSAIRIGAPLKEVTAFVNNHQQELAALPFHAFIACLTLAEDTEENRLTVSSYLESIRTLVPPTSEGSFAGVMDLKKLTLLERAAIKAMKSPEGDFRDWDAINTWAADIAASLG